MHKPRTSAKARLSNAQGDSSKSAGSLDARSGNGDDLDRQSLGTKAAIEARIKQAEEREKNSGPASRRDSERKDEFTPRGKRKDEFTPRGISAGFKAENLTKLPPVINKLL